MIHALAGEQPHQARVLRLENKGPGSKDAITRYVRTAIEQHTAPKADASLEELAEIITTAVLNRLGAGYALPEQRH
jgi:penicillin V acylase-like amidase (Ntn superfamily)